MGIHNSLKPILIEEYSEEFELIVAEIKVSNKEIRIMTGYGPQENWVESERLPFFMALEKEIVKSINEGKSIWIELDANSKLGSDIIPEDPHVQTAN